MEKDVEGGVEASILALGGGGDTRASLSEKLINIFGITRGRSSEV